MPQYENPRDPSLESVAPLDAVPHIDGLLPTPAPRQPSYSSLICFVASDLIGTRYEVSFVSATPESPCRLGIREFGTNNEWLVYQVEQHRGARHGAIVEVFEHVLDELKNPLTFEQGIEFLDNLAETTMVQRGLQSADMLHPNPLVMSRADALRLLQEYEIPIERWGQDASKGVHSLLQEIERGECRLIVRNGQLIRYLDVVRVMVDYHPPQGESLRLVETRQVFPNGTERVRNVPFSVGEKTMPFETSVECLSRGLIEELGLEAVPIPTGGEMSAWEGECRDYPGLISLKIFSDFHIDLPDDLFRPEGYVERNGTLTTEFRWKPIEQALLESNGS